MCRARAGNSEFCMAHVYFCFFLDSTFSINSIILQRFLLGGLAIAVPGEVHGLRRAWSDYHQLPWGTLVQPAINLSREGFPISAAVAEALSEEDMVKKIKNDPGLR